MGGPNRCVGSHFRAMNTLIAHLADAATLILREGNSIVRINEDPGWTPLVVMLCLVVVLVTGAFAIRAARRPADSWRFLLIHGFTLLITAAVGLMMHLFMVWTSWKDALMVNTWDPRMEVLDRALMAKDGMGYCAVVVIGAIMAIIALLRRKEA
jgi:hypothetical protein